MKITQYAIRMWKLVVITVISWLGVGLEWDMYRHVAWTGPAEIIGFSKGTDNTIYVNMKAANGHKFRILNSELLLVRLQGNITTFPCIIMEDGAGACQVPQKK